MSIASHHPLSPALKPHAAHALLATTAGGAVVALVLRFDAPPVFAAMVLLGAAIVMLLRSEVATLAARVPGSLFSSRRQQASGHVERYSSDLEITFRDIGGPRRAHMLYFELAAETSGTTGSCWRSPPSAALSRVGGSAARRDGSRDNDWRRRWRP